MDSKAQVREFLTTRRAKLTPARAGLPVDGVRRVPGLRRGEVASLAGVSIEYYAKIGRGDLSGVSESVLEAIARALQLDGAEREHLYHLAALFHGSPALRRSRRRAAKAWAPSVGLQRILDLMPDAPAVIYNGRGDVLATNHLGRALYSSVFAAQPELPNFNRYMFLDESAHAFYPDWGTFADNAVAMLRAETGRNPHDRALMELIGELSTHSTEFSRRWNAHDVRIHTRGEKTFAHPLVGELALSFESFELVAEPGLTLSIFAAEPSTPAAASLRLLASWTTASAVGLKQGVQSRDS